MIYAIVDLLDQPPPKRTRFSDSSDLFGNSKGSPQTFQHMPTKPLAEVRAKIDQIRDRYRPIMQTLVIKAGRQPLIPHWIPKTKSGDANVVDAAFISRIETLAIPSVKDLPCLLLHELGSEMSVMNQKQTKYVDEIFSRYYHTCVYNCNSLCHVD